MVRTKKTSTAFITHTTPDMGVDKCFKCDLAMNRPGEKRPGICCKQCGKEHCNKCAGLPVELCEMMRSTAKGLFTCSECESKGADMKAVLESMQSIKSELGTIKNGQAEQQAERVQVLEGLKVVKEVAKRLERIEDVQDKQEQRLTTNEGAIKVNTQKREDGEKRISLLEERMGKIDQKAIDMRQCNAVAKEVRELEKREKNIVIFNVPEPTDKEEEERRKADMRRVLEVFKELDSEGIQPSNVGRIGKKGRFPQQIRVTLPSTDDCDKLVQKSRDGPALTDSIFVTRDRTFNQRQEAKLIRMEKVEEGDGNANQPGRGRGARPRGRPRGRGAGRGRGGRGAGAWGGGGGGDDSQSRKRRSSNDEVTPGENDEESKRRKTAGDAAGTSTRTAAQVTPTQARTKPTSDHQATPRSTSGSGLGAVGGEDDNF